MMFMPSSRIFILLALFVVCTNAQNPTTPSTNNGSIFSFFGNVRNQSASFVQNLTQPLTNAINSVNISSIISVSTLKNYKDGLLNSTMVVMIRSLIDALFGDKSNSTDVERIRKELA